MLPKEWPKRVIDCNVKKITEKDLAWADYAFISGMVVQRDTARRGGGRPSGGRQDGWRRSY